MREMNRFGLLAILFLALLSLISCTEKSRIATNSPVPTLLSTNDGFATLVDRSSTIIASMPTSTKTPFREPSPTDTPLLIPSGKLLFIDSSTKEGVNASGLTMLNIETSETTFITEGSQEIDNLPIILFSSNIAISPDGHWIASVGSDVRANLWIYAYQDIYISRADGTDLYRLTYSPQFDKYQLTWSPDGASILVVMGKDGFRDLYLVSVRDGVIIQRFTSSGNIVAGTWAPDGKRIAFAENSKLFLIDISNKTPQLISDLPDATIEEISWSPSGDKLALSILGNHRDCGDIFIFDLQSMKIENLTDDDYAERSPYWSPDGQHVVFSRATYHCNEPVGQGIWDIYLSDTGGNKQLIYPDVVFRTSVSWMPVPRLEIGKQYTTTDLGENLNLRAEPSISGKILTTLPVGEIITVLDGPIDADDYYWWKIRTQDGTEGWIVEMAYWYKPLNE